jgi:hypothetical protein
LTINEVIQKAHRAALPDYTACIALFFGATPRNSSSSAKWQAQWRYKQNLIKQNLTGFGEGFLKRSFRTCQV